MDTAALDEFLAKVDKVHDEVLHLRDNKDPLTEEEKREMEKDLVPAATEMVPASGSSPATTSTAMPSPTSAVPAAPSSSLTAASSASPVQQNQNAFFGSLEKDAAERHARRRVREEEADALKAEGNDLLRAGDTRGAEAKYTEALEACKSRPAVLANRAQARLVLGNHTGALEDCDKLIELAEIGIINPGKALIAKAHFRRARALEGLGRDSDAALAAKRASEVEPSNAEIAREALRLRAAAEKEKGVSEKGKESAAGDERCSVVATRAAEESGADGAVRAERWRWLADEGDDDERFLVACETHLSGPSAPEARAAGVYDALAARGFVPGPTSVAEATRTQEGRDRANRAVRARRVLYNKACLDWLGERCFPRAESPGPQSEDGDRGGDRLAAFTTVKHLLSDKDMRAGVAKVLCRNGRAAETWCDALGSTACPEPAYACVALMLGFDPRAAGLLAGAIAASGVAGKLASRQTAEDIPSHVLAFLSHAGPRVAAADTAQRKTLLSLFAGVLAAGKSAGDAHARAQVAVRGLAALKVGSASGDASEADAVTDAAIDALLASRHANACLVISQMAALGEGVRARLAARDAVRTLVDILSSHKADAKAAHGNAKIALARFAIDPAHAQQVRDLHGLELMNVPTSLPSAASQVSPGAPRDNDDDDGGGGGGGDDDGEGGKE